MSDSTKLLGYGRRWKILARLVVPRLLGSKFGQGLRLVEARLGGCMNPDLRLEHPTGWSTPTQVSSEAPARPQTYASVTPKPRRRGDTIFSFNLHRFESFKKSLLGARKTLRSGTKQLIYRIHKFITPNSRWAFTTLGI